MIRDCGTCGGTGRILYHGENEWTDCPVCDGTGEERVEPEDPRAVTEPDSLGGKSARGDDLDPARGIIFTAALEVVTGGIVGAVWTLWLVAG